MSIIIKGHNEAYYYSGDNLYTGTCDISKYETIYFYADGTYIGMTPKMYILDIGMSATDECLIGIAEFTGYNSFLLGDVFIKE